MAGLCGQRVIEWLISYYVRVRQQYDREIRLRNAFIQNLFRRSVGNSPIENLQVFRAMVRQSSLPTSMKDELYQMLDDRALEGLLDQTDDIAIEPEGGQDSNDHVRTDAATDVPTPDAWSILSDD